ncbi:MAG: glutathione S-transferase family protein [Pseudomonadota bacterium]
MKLISLDASPFVRKARVLVIELGLQDTVLIHNPGAVTPISNNDQLNSLNPLGMIPALELDDGSTLSDSNVICEYLNHIGHGNFYPADTALRFQTLGIMAIADGILDLSVAVRYELAIRPEALHWQEWITHQNEKVERALDTLESRSSHFQSQPLIGEVTVACALGYRDFRFGDNDWRQNRPGLSSWYETISQRESFKQTIPA